MEQPDLGSGHFAATVRHLKAEKPSILVECLTPDFCGQEDKIDLVAGSGLDVFAHNLETGTGRYSCVIWLCWWSLRVMLH